MVLEGQGIPFVVIDVAASAEEKAKMREIAQHETALPPQIANGDTYCGVRNYHIYITKYICVIKRSNVHSRLSP